MNEEESINKIKSKYNYNQRLLLSFPKNKSSIYYNTITSSLNTNNKKKIKLINFNKKFINRPKSTISKINEFFRSNIKNHSNNSHINTIEQEILSFRNNTLSENNFQNDFIKINKIVYLLRKLFVILPNDKKQMYTKCYPTRLFFNFYFPIRTSNYKANLDFIKAPKKEDIICDDLNHILHEVYKYLKLSIYDSVKMEIYDEKFNPIIKEWQLLTSNRRIIYVKISYLKEKEIISWRKRVESKLFPIDDDYLIKKEKKLFNNQIPSLYKDEGTEYNNNDIRIISKYKDKSDLNNVLTKKINLTENCLNVDTKNLYNKINSNANNHNYNKTVSNNESEKNKTELNLDYYKEIDKDNYEEEIIDNLFVSSDEKNFLSLRKSRQSLSLFSKDLIKKVLNTESKGTQGKINFSLSEENKNKNKDISNSNTNINNNYNYYTSNIKTININNGNDIFQQEPKSSKCIKKIMENKIVKNKKNKGVLYNLIKQNKTYKIKNNLLSPLLFNFDVNDIINNKYVLKYLTNKNKEKFENEIFTIKCRNIKIKNLNEEDSNSHRKLFIDKKSNNKLPKKARNNVFNLEHDEDEIKEYKEHNLKKYCNINMKLNEFIINGIDSLFTNEETGDFKSLNYNYILINELKEFPISKLKKEFLFYSCLSLRLKLNYGNLLNKIKAILLDNNSNGNDIQDIFLLEDFDNLLNYLDDIIHKLINNKMNLFRYIGYSNADIKINYVFLILFIIYNGNLLEKNGSKKIIFLSLECIDIPFDRDMNFQHYCDYKLVMTKNSYISYNKKFNFIKDLLLRVLVNENFNKKNTLGKLNVIFDINFNDIKNIFKLDMCTVKSKQNIEVYKKIEKLYEDLLSYNCLFQSS